MNNKLTLEQLREILIEDIEKLPPNANYTAISADLKNDSFEGFCQQLDFLATSNDQKALALYNTFKKGWKKQYGDVEAVLSAMPVAFLQPTQNVIYAKKSLVPVLTNDKWCQVPGYKYAVDAFTAEEPPVITLGDPLVVCHVGDRDFIIDGHHRWSKVYAFNPNCYMAAYNIINAGNIFPTPDDVLKFAQGTITALKKTSPIDKDASAGGPNMYDMTYNELKGIVDCVDGDVEKHIVNSALLKNMNFNEKLSTRDRICIYLWGNINKLIGNTRLGKHDRIYMPQYPRQTSPIKAVDLIAAESSKRRNGKTLTLEELAKILRF